jgi:D-alanyl-D-alanine dipeptidase
VGSKVQLFEQGYIAAKSGHSRGSTVDLTMIELGKPLKQVEEQRRTLADDTEIPFLDDGTVDMGSSWDLFHAASNHESPLIIDPNQIVRRNLLREVMARHGYIETPEEWWHYTLSGEPFPDTYFDFVF